MKITKSGDPGFADQKKTRYLGIDFDLMANFALIKYSNVDKINTMCRFVSSRREFVRQHENRVLKRILLMMLFLNLYDLFVIINQMNSMLICIDRIFVMQA